MLGDSHQPQESPNELLPRPDRCPRPRCLRRCLQLGPVITRLQAAGLDAVAVPNPLRGLAVDGDDIASLVSQIEGDVVLVGHSYGGPVITQAASSADNVRALVFVASFGLDHGQSIPASLAGFPEPLLNTSMTPRSYPDGFGSSSAEVYSRRTSSPRCSPGTCQPTRWRFSRSANGPYRLPASSSR